MDIFPASSSSVSLNKTLTLITIGRTALQLRVWGGKRGRKEMMERKKKKQGERERRVERKAGLLIKNRPLNTPQSERSLPCLPQNLWSWRRPRPWPWSWR